MNKWKSVAISFVIAIIFGLASFFMPNRVDLFWSVAVSVITFIISYIFVELTGYIDRLHDIETNDKYKFFQECGISEYHKDFSKIDFSPCIIGANHIRIVLLYSSKFVSTYINSLRSFVEREGTTLEFILISNNGSNNSYKYLSEKFGYGENGLAERIAEFHRLITEDLLPSKNAKSTVKLYYSSVIPTYSLYMFDNYAYITLYKTAPQRTTLIPCFRVEKAYDSSFYNFLENDFSETKVKSTQEV